MAEPVSNALAVGGVFLSGAILGIDYGVLMAGLCGGLWALSKKPPMEQRWKYVTSVVLATVFSGFLTTFIVAIAPYIVDWGKAFYAVRYPVAFFCALFSSPLVDNAIKAIDRLPNLIPTKGDQ